MISGDSMRLPGWQGGNGDAAYLDKTLRHREVETSLDDSVSWRFMLSLWLRGLFVAFVVLFVFAVLSLLLEIGGSLEGAAGLSILGSIGSVAAFWVIVLCTKAQEPIAEWRVLLADRQDSAESVYSQISGALLHRRIPLAHGSRRIRTGFGANEVSNRMVLSEGSYLAYVSVFPYGTSLYLGWTMWRSRRGYQLVWQFIVDILLSAFGRTDPDRIMLRTERPRAMREAVHAACREGLFVAIEQREVAASFGYPNGMPPVQNPVQNGAGLSAPVPDALRAQGQQPQFPAQQ
ncbi:adhesin [Solihabitans fulvus]|uniref:Adhesin n=1 Tax=Solihabitans fulvus TaxID=1892852 RepID=A0A5B2WLM7_9PSEU|nr:adhesin [Solihabitans fulvus]KAA2251369.1 adhesin [Solihabitans fulvus]